MLFSGDTSQLFIFIFQSLFLNYLFIVIIIIIIIRSSSSSSSSSRIIILFCFIRIFHNQYISILTIVCIFITGISMLMRRPFYKLADSNDLLKFHRGLFNGLNKLNMRSLQLLLILKVHVVEFANSVDSDEAAHNEPFTLN